MATTTVTDPAASGTAAVLSDTSDGAADEATAAQSPSLIIPITSSNSTTNGDDSNSNNMFVEIFPEEITQTSTIVLKQVLRDEQPHNSGLWADAALMYMQQKQAREALTLLDEACEQLGSTSSSTSNISDAANKNERVRLLAATGIAHLAVAGSKNQQQRGGRGASGAGGVGGADDDDHETQADQRFTQAGKIDTFFPMTWVGRGMLKFNQGNLEQAKFFFSTTLKQCGPVLPALLGLAAVLFGQGEYAAAQAQYAEAIRRHPAASGAGARVGFGLTCYKLGQVDRAKAAFSRALALDPECVQAMVGSAILDMAGDEDDATSQHVRTERAIKILSMANLLEHSNAMVQNHLANHYFWKWTPVIGTVQVTQGSTLVKASQPMPLDSGDPIRIGTRFETTVQDDPNLEEEDQDGHYFRLGMPWKEESSDNLKVWKKDYERVFALAKGAYSSTRVQAIQAESLFFLARVYHVREDMDNAHKFYQKACELAPDLTPARFGLAQTLIVKGEYNQARRQLDKLLSTSPNATDALALAGLLQVNVSSGAKLEEGLVQLRKAIDLDPLNPELVVLEAMALQQHKSNYPKSLQKYQKAVELMQRSNASVPADIFNNIGVLSQETKKFDQALEYYKQALFAVDDSGQARTAKLENSGVGGGKIEHMDNEMFFGFVQLPTPVQVQFVGDENPSVKVVSPESVDESSLGVKEGEMVKIGKNFYAKVESITQDGDSLVLELDQASESSEKDCNDDEDALPLLVQRENNLLDLPEVTTIAFNIARLHEATGRTEGAIEIHKSLIKRNPAYINSYLRLACIAVDNGALKECSEWLKLGAACSPGNAEVLTLIGNLHLSLCDWQPARDVFDGLMGKKIAEVEAYAALSLGNIYFETMHVSGSRYAKQLGYARDYYKRILSKDPLNAYAANGLGTVLAENGEIFKAKEVFNRVREVSEDNIADALLNLGHIYLAQKKHPEALQMYQSYMKRVEDVSTPTTSKSRADELVDVLLYIAFAYFDWARHTELFNDADAAPADGRYKKAMEHLEAALEKGTKKQVVLKYNLCMTKLQAANCVLQKLTRNIPRTVEEVEEALNGLKESLAVVEEILKEKEGGAKVPIKSSTLEDFLKHCRANIGSAQSHLEDEKKRAEEEKAEREIRRMEAEIKMRSEEIKKALEQEEEQKKQEELDKRAEDKMKKLEELKASWDQQQAQEEAEKDKKSKKRTGDMEVVGEMEIEEPAVPSGHGLFDDSDDSDDDEEDDGKSSKNGEGDNAPEENHARPSQSELFGDSDDDGDAGGAQPEEGNKDEDKQNAGDKSEDEFDGSGAAEANKPVSKDLFGDSEEDESDEELVRKDGKREAASPGEDGQPQKKRRVLEDED